MIIDLARFIRSERPVWSELDRMLDRLEGDPHRKLPLSDAQRLHYLYERASADLGRIMTVSAEPEIRRYLESLVARAYGEIHETREKQHRLSPLQWFTYTLPQTFRRRWRAFVLAVAVTAAGGFFGGVAVTVDPEAKSITIPFANLHGDPSERVAREERVTGDHLQGAKARGTAFYITNNTSVAFKTLAFGVTWGIGTMIVLFSTGVMLGAVSMDYILAGQTEFLIGWLLPHGSFEIPAILIAGQAGLMLGGALIGWGSRQTVGERLSAISRDLVTLIAGVTLMLIWAGVIEAWFSQYHEPVLPYRVKIAFGCVEGVVLAAYFGWSGTRRTARRESHPERIARE
jgi:uncharacterized membrane protein SpoIIM required for sporulation